MSDEYLDIDQIRRQQAANTLQDIYVTSGPTTGSVPSRASVEERTVARSQSGQYHLAGDGQIRYSNAVSGGTKKPDNVDEERETESCFKAHERKIWVTVIVIIIIGAATGVGVSFGTLQTSAKANNDTGMTK